MEKEQHSFHLYDMKNGEKIQLVLKRHWITLTYTFGHFLFLLLSVAIFLGFKSVALSMIHDSLLNLFLIVYISIFLLVIYIGWMKYELDLFIITNKRVIGIEQKSFMDRNISECSLEDVQEVNARTDGYLRNLLDYGVVTIHTASEKSEFEMDFLPSPFENQRKMTNVISEFKMSRQNTSI
ncbi:MAG: hypothetical protein PHS92_04110 [Candidatus Gracilibacteria bacterium]|nr:hypothetical protein [Candidatus Gracilibacteria bacterium]